MLTASLTAASINRMNIQTYIKNLKHGEKAGFAKKLGITSTHLYMLEVGLRRPGGKVLINIEDATDGQVTAKECRPDQVAAA